MNFSTSEFMLGRQRGRQWVPLISQQFRLRHVYQIIGFNLLSEAAGSYYFTLHLTTMCAPFYTSKKICNPNPKWPELDLKDVANTSASCIVLRIWQHSSDGADKILLTWGVHFSGLVYIGNKIAEIQPVYFKNNSVIFYMQGGYYTSHHVIKTDLQKPIPFLNNINLINTLNNKVVYKRIAIKAAQSEIQDSYTLDKLRKLHCLQVQIKKKSVEVQNVRDKINSQNCSDCGSKVENLKSIPSPSACNIRYAPQLLTMNSLNRMLQEKPTKVQKQEMTKISKEIEIERFKLRLLSQEKDKKSVIIRQLKQKHSEMTEENEERNFILLEDYHLLSREGERLREFKKNVLQHRELLSLLYFQLHHRRKKLLQELLFIYPIEKQNDDEYTVHGIYLPKSDVLADYPDTGLSVALGYVTHMLVMCSAFLQVPLRYPLTHYGSRSYVTDNASPLLPEKDRDFPLYTRGKDKAHFTYAVYLLNKNLAQLRWLFYMNTNDLKSTLSNLLTFLQGQKEFRVELPSPMLANVRYDQQSDPKSATCVPPPGGLGGSEKYVSLHSFSSNSNISDPILDSIRHENQIRRSGSPTRKPSRKPVSNQCRNSECGRGLSEILAVPEAFLSKQMSSDSFRNYMAISRNGSCCEASPASDSTLGLIKITNGKEVDRSRAVNIRIGDKTTLINQESIEQGTDPLDPSSSFSPVITKSIDIQPGRQLDNRLFGDGSIVNKRISRSMGSYTDDETSSVSRTNFDVVSEPQLSLSDDSNLKCEEIKSVVLPRSLEEGNQELLEKWLNATPHLVYSDENLYSDEYLSSSSQYVSHDTPLMARTDALLKTKSFNLVKPKP